MASSDKSKKKPKKTSVSKKKQTPASLSAIDPSTAAQSTLASMNDAIPIVEDVIKQAFLRFYDTAQIKQHKVKDLEHLDTIVAEFLKTFVILGYDLNGEKVFIMHALNPHDRDALVEHLRTTLLGIINQQG